MKLYYFTGACALSPHIVAQEIGIHLDLVKIDPKTKQTADGADYLKVNSKGSVPALQLDNGEVLTDIGRGPTFYDCLVDVEAAKRRFTLEDHARMTAGVECRKDAEVIDETPAAYKPIDDVMAAQADLVDIVHTLRQVICVKG